MSKVQPILITNERLNAARERDRDLQRLELQVKALRNALDAATQEIQLLTYERDELLAALRDWACQRA